MKNKKILFILIPIILIVLILIAGVVYLKINGTPKKIFKKTISSAFEIFETSEEQYSTMKGTMNLTASIESDNEEIQAISTMLKEANIGLNMEVDTSNMVVNENINVTYSNKSLLNATAILQDEKGYVYLPDWLDKYLEIPQEYMGDSNLTETSGKIATLDQKALMEAVEEEVIKAISQKEFTQNKNGKVKISTLSLSQQQFFALCKELLENLKQNEKFNSSLGDYKEDIIEGINNIIIELEDTEYDEDYSAVISIYTKGLLNKFTGFSIELKDGEDVVSGIIATIEKQNYEVTLYEQYDGEKTELVKIKAEDKKENKNKGTTKITVTAQEEDFVIVCNYETQKNQTTFEASTEIEGLKVIASGNVVKNGKNYKGNLILTAEESELGKINLNCAYDFTYGVEVKKVDVGNAVIINELNEKDQETLVTNLQNSVLYKFIEQSGLLEGNIVTGSDKPEVTYDGYTVKYTVPDNFEASTYNSEEMKTYRDDNYNTITVSIDYDTVDDYTKDLEKEYNLTSSLYKNQKISETKTYTVNGKEYKLRTITYEDDYGTYVDLYFAYKLDDEYCYVVEVETEGGNISMDTIEYFLDATVE